jgi:hypothetical protein
MTVVLVTRKNNEISIWFLFAFFCPSWTSTFWSLLVTGCTNKLNILTTVRSVHTVFTRTCMCFVFVWEQTATCATYSINWLVFITEMKCLQRGTDWAFKWSSLRSVFWRLTNAISGTARVPHVAVSWFVRPWYEITRSTCNLCCTFR